MKRTILALLLFAQIVCAQNYIRWAATTGNISLSGAGTTATIQQPASNASQELIDQIVVYCSVSCTVTQTANGTAASTTAGTVTPILPTQLNIIVPVNFFTSSNVGAGSTQGGAVNLVGPDTKTFCLTPSCGNPSQVSLGTGGTGANYSVVISSITGTANITFYGRAVN